MQREELPIKLPPADSLPPSLVMCGDCDPLADPVDSQSLAHALGTESEVVTGSGHDVMLDNEWRQFADRLCEFIKGLP